MADFLGSYYDSANLDGSEVDEKVISQRMALLSVEQPVSVMEMDNLESVQRPARERNLTALRQNVEQLQPAEGINKFREKLSSDDGYDSGEDLDIPVASMSTFEQGQPSMVSVQLLSVQGEGFQRCQPSGAAQNAPCRPANELKGKETLYSPISDPNTGWSSMRKTRGSLKSRNQREEVTLMVEENRTGTPVDDEKHTEGAKPGRRNSLFRFLSRKHDNKVKSRRN